MERFISQPNSTFYRRWNFFILCITLYNIIEIPFRICFKPHLPPHFYFIDYFLDACLIATIGFNFFRGYYADGMIVTEPAKTAAHYLHKKFPRQATASFPLDFIALCSGVGTQVIPWLRLPRLLWSPEILTFFNDLERNVKVNPGYIRLIKLALAVLIWAHTFGCVFFYIGSLEIPTGNSWLIAQHLENESLFTQYVRSVYWSMTTMATVGYGDIVPVTRAETIFVLFAEFAGVSIFAYLVGSIAILVANLNAVTQAYRHKMDAVHNYLKLRDIPAGLEERIKNFYDYLWFRSNGIDDAEVLKDLPVSLKTETALYIHRKGLSQVPIFQGISPLCLNAIVKLFKNEIYTPGDYIIRQGEIGKEMYFISRGTVEVVSGDGKTVFATLRDGAFFGEIALLFAERRTASVKALTYCDLFCLKKEDLQSVLKDYPDLEQDMLRIAKERYNKGM